MFGGESKRVLPGRSAREVNDRGRQVERLLVLLINLLGNDSSHATRTLLSRLRHASKREHAGLPRARGNRRRGTARGVLRGAPPQRPAAPPPGKLPRPR